MDRHGIWSGSLNATRRTLHAHLVFLIILATQPANTPCVCLVRKASSYLFTEDWKICSPFPEQFDAFYQREVKEKENRTGASGEFLNGCPK
jgi:hypothetical protein